MMRALFTLCIALLTASHLMAKEFVWEAQSDIIGEQSIITATYTDTLSDIGESNNIGYTEIIHANPTVDAWLPGEGSEVVIPSEYILPSVREGIVINLREYRLYYFPKDGGKVITYPVGVGKDESPSPQVKTRVKLKIEQPNWYPPQSVRDEYFEEHGEVMPKMFTPGPDNPLGPYAIMLDLPSYFLHGTNKPFGIGTKVSHGCIRLYNEDISKLVYQVPKQTPVSFIKEPIKMGMKGDILFVELHPDKSDNISNRKMVQHILEAAAKLEKHYGELSLDINAIEQATNQPLGTPQPIGKKKADVVIASPSMTSSTVN